MLPCASLPGSADVPAALSGGSRAALPPADRPTRARPSPPAHPPSLPSCRSALCLPLVLVLSSLGGCGNRGELYLPPDEALEREVLDIDERLPALSPDVNVTTPADTVNSRTPLPTNEVEDSVLSGEETPDEEGSTVDGEHDGDDSPLRRRGDGDGPSDGTER